MPSIPNPIDIIGQSLGGSLADLAESAFNQAMRTLWDFSLSLLKGVLGVIDHLTVPNLDPKAGPLSSVMPAATAPRTRFIGRKPVLAMRAARFASVNGSLK